MLLRRHKKNYEPQITKVEETAAAPPKTAGEKNGRAKRSKAKTE